MLTALILATCLIGQARGHTEFPNGQIHDGVEVTVDIPPEMRVRNFGADNFPHYGLCGVASLQMAASVQNVRALRKLMYWEVEIDAKGEKHARHYCKVKDGGVWPAKINEIVAREAPGLEVVHYEGPDPTAFIERAMAMGLPVCGTYGYGEFYRNQTIAHMVVYSSFGPKWASINDNNDIEHTTWILRAESIRRAVHPSGRAWFFVLLAPPWPPVPRNTESLAAMLFLTPIGPADRSRRVTIRDARNDRNEIS